MDKQQRFISAALIGLVWICGSLLRPFPLLAADSRESSGAQLTVLASNEHAVVVALTVDGFEIEQLNEAGERYQRVLIPHTEQTMIPGAPQVPSWGALLGVPTSVGVTLQVISADYQLLSGYRLFPAPWVTLATDDLSSFTGGELTELFAPDEQHYTTDAFYPAAPAKLGAVGLLRDQAVAQVQFYPLQYNPVHSELRLYREIVVQISWDETAVQSANASARAASPAYEEMLRTALINYATLQRPAAITVAASSPVEQGEQNHSAPALKIGLNADGIYSLTYADLVNAGFNPGAVDPRRLKMTNQGADVPIHVEGEADSFFDSTDFILFYGTAIRNAYTTQNVYWLSVGAEPGLRMEQRSGAPSGNAPSPIHFPHTLHAEEDTAYWQHMPGHGESRWFWQNRFSPNTEGLPTQRDYQIVLGQISALAETATVRVRLKGYTGLGHRTRLYLNDQLIDDQSWQGQVHYDHQVNISHSLLKSGQNLVRVEAVDTGAVVDQILLDWIEIDYWNRFEADNDHLLFAASGVGLQQFTINGFVQAELSVFDVTDPAHPIRIVNPSIERNEGRYQLVMEADAQSTSRFLALATDYYQSPVSVSLDQPSTWKSSSNGADYIIITHEDFFASAQILASHRSAAGLRVATVPIGDVYDEFSDGIFNPQAIRTFLRYAFENWAAPAPSYVVLMGDANQDYQDNLKTGTRNFVPSQNIESALFGEVSSDNWFVQVSGVDVLPDMFIGRLSAQNRQEAEAIVAKIIQYDQQPPDDSWNKTMLLVADDDEEKFQAISEQLATRLPYYYAVNRIYTAAYPPGDPHTDIISHINNGVLLVNYAGHGEYFGWGRWNREAERIFHRSDVEALYNANKLPLITVGNCLNGFFAGPQDNPALAETLQRQPNAGAIAVWAPTGYGYSTGHQILLDEFYRAIFVEDQQELGPSTTGAKLATYAHSSFWSELIETYILFGDPATRLGIPTNFPYVKYTAPANGVSDVALDQAVQVVFNKPMDPHSVALGSSDGALSFTASWNADFTVVNYRHSGFAHGGNYQLMLYGQDRYGNSLGPGTVPVPWSLTATTDTTPPSATFAVLGNALSSVLATSAIVANFTEPVRVRSVTVSITPYVRGSLQWDSYGQRAVFTHDDFVVGQIYTFTILTATDVAGNALPGSVQIAFTAGDTLYAHFPLLFAGD